LSSIQMSPDQVVAAAEALLAQMKAGEEEIEDILGPNDFAPASAHGTAVPQQTGTEQVYDKTQLHMLQGMNLMRIHRDYLAHAIRYEFLIQRIKQSGPEAMVLDIGCGDVPLMRAMRSSMLRPRFYLGVDVRPRMIEKVTTYYRDHKVHFPFDVRYMDFTEADPKLLGLKWTQVVCLEVIEHMPRGRGEMLLQNIKSALSQGGTGYISTPCFDGSRKAQHHRYEWDRSELENALIQLGFKIENVWGTFGNVHDLKRVLTPEEKAVWNGLSQANGGYYGSIALSLIFSPLHPEAARNCVWEVQV
jgi:2-polyprenyl-3-methyl-5-hydroxy-6-metoxy-1,4-benzoquinol methylase